MQDVLLVLETSCVQSSVAAWSGESLLCQACLLYTSDAADD